jgi:hypothetical protein
MNTNINYDDSEFMVALLGYIAGSENCKDQEVEFAGEHDTACKGC